MKRNLCLLLAVLFSCCMAACHYSDGGDILEPVEFFYPLKTTSFVYGSAEGVIASEVREASGHVNDLNYLIAMYLRGPQNSAMRMPFPSGCTLEEISTEDQTLHICLSPELADLENTDLTLACAALAKTCLNITNYDFVCIDATSDEQTISMVFDQESVLFADYSVFTPPAAATEP